jgi:hypothetical protein
MRTSTWDICLEGEEERIILAEEMVIVIPGFL